MISALPLVLLLLAGNVAHAATQVGSAPYRMSATGAGNSYAPVFNADGKHVAFVSHANNLVTNDDLAPHLDLFVRDLVSSNTVLVNVSTNGFGGGNDNIGLYTLSSNAQVIAFDTAASNLLPWDNNRVSDVYVRNLAIGGMTRVSVGVDGDANGPSSNPLISEDGRYVIFESLASNLVTNDFNGTNDIFIHDLTTGVTTLVSVNANGTASPDGPSHSPSISADGLTVAFVSRATNLVNGVTNLLDEIYVRDIAGGTNQWAVASHLSNTRFRSPASGLLGPYSASEPVLSADGRYVLFKTIGQTVRYDLHRSTNVVIQLFPASPVQGALSNYFRFDDNPRLVTSASETPVWFSRDGRFAVYSTRTNVVPQPGVLLVDFESFATNVTYVTAEGSSANYWFTNQIPWAKMVLTNAVISFPGSGKTWTQMPWLAASFDVTRILFLADATNLVAVVTNRTFQIYSVGVADGSLQLLSTNSSSGPCLNLAGIVPAISPDGSLIAWDSPDDNIIPDDLNRAWDVFVRNVDTGETQPISARHPDLPAASGPAMSRLDLNSGAISANGQRLAILSLDSTLAPDDTNRWRDLFVRDLVTGETFDASRSVGRVGFLAQTNFPGTNTAAAPSLSADGRYVTFAGEISFTTQFTNRAIYWRDLQASSNRFIAAGSSVSVSVLSPDGQFLAFHSGDSLVPGFPDGNNVQDVFVYQMTGASPPFPPIYDGCVLPVDFIGGRIASRTPSDLSVGNGPSINPAFSPDSFWILFQSRATDLTGQPLPPQSQYQLYGRGVWSTNVFLPGCIGLFPGRGYSPTKLISYTTSASSEPDGRSIELPLPGGGANPRFSADSRYVAFESATNLIYRHDLLGGFVSTVTEQDGVLHTNLARLTNDLVCTGCANPTLSADGRHVAYETRRGSDVMNDVFVKDMQTGQEDLISVNFVGTGGGNGSSSTPLLSHDARFVVFASKASDIVPGDNNRATDIFLRDRVNGVTHCLSRNWRGTGTGNRVSSNPIMSADGRTVAFQSFASDLVAGDFNDTRDVFVVTLAGPDTDGDGMDDDWEMAYFSTLARDGSGDFDGDGASDRDEFRAGTNPANNASILRVIRIASAVPAPPPLNHQRTTVLWSASPGKTYRVQFKENVDAPWTDLPGEITAGGTSATATHSVFATTPRGFYRVLLVP